MLALVLLGVAPGHAQSDASAPTNVTDELFNADIDAPALVAPVSDSVTTALTDPPVGVPTLEWASVSGATKYEVQIGSAEGFGSTIIDQVTTATSYTPKVVLADNTYFWHVRAQINQEWGVYSDAWSFRKEWSAGGQVKPVLLSPADDPGGQQVITSFSPDMFSWAPVVGAASYKLEISVSPSFNDAQIYRATTIKPHHTPKTQLDNNQYYWRVIPLDSGDNAGEPSDTRSFTFGWNQVPDLVSPEDNIDTRFVPRFTWTAAQGASAYVLDISSQENFSNVDLSVTTKNSSYTPEKALANNKDYFWRVRALSPHNVNGPVSATRSFHANWIEPPILLSPPAHSINHIYPYFSWTPVAGAERYQLQISSGTGFDNLIVDTKIVNATGYTQGHWPEIVFGADYFWRVRALDAQDNTTNWSSEQTFHFAGDPPPNLIYPEPYYEADANGTPVHDDRTIAQPIFVWDSTHEWLGNVNGGNGPGAFVYPDYYRLEVSTSSDFATIAFTIDSAGQGAAPTKQNPFNTLTDGQIYYWRVNAEYGGGHAVLGTVWETRIDRSHQQLPLDSDNVPDLMHPQDGFTSVSVAPVLGWLPVANADHYSVQISDKRDFSSVVDSADALFAYYVPWQGRQTRIPAGAYWWRVQARNADDQALGNWSNTQHFIVMNNLMTGNPHDYVVPTPPETLLGAGDPLKYDPALNLVASNTTTVAAPYNLGELHVVQDRSIIPTQRNWIIAFGADDGITGTLTYALYLDVNQKEGVGGATDPRGKAVTFDPLYQPDYVIYLERTGDAITSASYYIWDATHWSSPFALTNEIGSFGYDATTHAVEVIFSYSLITLVQDDQFSGGVALTVYSSGSATNAPLMNSVPQQGAIMDRPALFSNMPTPLYPFDTPLSDPVVLHATPTLRWRMPDYNSIDGYVVEIARNPNFTNDSIVASSDNFESDTASYYGGLPTAFHPSNAFDDDESYYWRVQYRHERFGKANEYDVSPWSAPMRFKLTSYQPGNPTVTLGNSQTGEPAYATPSFTWDRVEGASRYKIQIDNDANMNSPITDKSIDGNSFTALETLADGTYYWRVAMQRDDTVVGQWTTTLSFTKSSLVPSLLSPISDSISNTVINGQPTFIWDVAISNTGELHIAAARYQLQWDDNPQFNSPVTVQTEATSYTPVKGESLADGTWFWHVAMIDGNNKIGPYSAVATFYKEYLRPEPLSPIQGSSLDDSIAFGWTPLDGAASYKLEIADNAAFDSPIQVTTQNTRYTHTNKLAPGEYHWRVQMIDKDSRPGPTIPGRFTQGTDSPAEQPKLYMPMLTVSN